MVLPGEFAARSWYIFTSMSVWKSRTAAPEDEDLLPIVLNGKFEFVSNSFHNAQQVGTPAAPLHVLVLDALDTVHSRDSASCARNSVKRRTALFLLSM